MLNSSNIPSEVQEVLQEKDRQIESLQNQVTMLCEQLTWLKNQVFGAKSERIVADLGQQSLPFADAEVATAPTEEIEQISYQRRKPLKNTGCDSIKYPADLPVKQIELDIPEKEKVCAQTGEPLVRIGEEVTRKLARKAEQFLSH